MGKLRKLRKSFTTVLWGGHNFETANLRQPTSYKARRTGRLRGVGVPPGGRESFGVAIWSWCKLGLAQIG